MEKQPLFLNEGGRQQTQNAIVTKYNLREYYEIDRMVQSCRNSKYTRIAVQFPDSSLSDAPSVLEALQSELPDSLVFCLGDTTYASCCPDYVAAAHLNADVLVHCGHACLSSTVRSPLPVVYIFGKQALPGHTHDTLKKALRREPFRKVVLLYDLKYRDSVEELSTSLAEQMDVLVVVGEIPDVSSPASDDNDNDHDAPSSTTLSYTARACCGGQDSEESCSKPNKVPIAASQDDQTPSRNAVMIGGLLVPSRILDWQDDYVLVFFGDETSPQYLNSALYCLSLHNPPKCFWTFHNGNLETEMPPRFRKLLNKRFYNVQKARDCQLFGILVAQMSAATIPVVKNVRELLDKSNKAHYTVVVGKINEAKLANFAEIDCFVLVACPEHSILQIDFPVPIITPLELLMSMEVVPWPGGSNGKSSYYSTQARDFFAGLDTGSFDNENEGETPDAPHFSVVKGAYCDSATTPSTLSTTEGTLTKYHSAAADFLKTREFRGLEFQDQTPVQVAIPGQSGIASKYTSGTNER